MRAALILPLTLGLAACGTPREQCVATATRDLTVINQLVAETELNLARGYSVKREPSIRTGLEVCVSPKREHFVFCTTQEATVKEVPVAINPSDERAKLVSLRAKQAELNANAAARIRQCEAQYPA